MFTDICEVCGQEMILQSYTDTKSGEKKNQFVCCNCNNKKDYKEESDHE